MNTKIKPPFHCRVCKGEFCQPCGQLAEVDYKNRDQCLCNNCAATQNVLSKKGENVGVKSVTAKPNQKQGGSTPGANAPGVALPESRELNADEIAARSFVSEVYDVEFAPQLGERADTFRAMLLHLESLNLSFYTIIETGCVRAEDDWTAGCSTVIFDRFVNFYDGQFISVDNNESHCRFALSRVSKKTQIICADSVQWLNDKSNKAKCHLLYLDSYDYDAAQDESTPIANPAAVHGWDEFASGFWRLERNALIAVDDNFDGGVRGKGVKVIAFLQSQNVVPVFAGRQWGWVPDHSNENAIEFHLAADGIGDAVTGYYAACGLADAGRNAVFYTKHPLWFSRVSHPGVTLLPYREHGVDANANYTAKLRYSGHWSQYFCDAIATGFNIPRFEPARPRDVDQTVHVRRLEGKYVLASPFALHDTRNWSPVQWRRLARLLLENGLQTIFTDGSGDEKGARLQDNFKFIGGLNAHCNFWGMSHEWIEDVMLGAACVVSNDSGMAHFAGLLGVSCISVHAQLTPRQLYGKLAMVRSAFAETACAGCAWQHDKGWRPECGGECSALMSISAERVFEAVCEAIESPVGNMRQGLGTGSGTGA